MSSIILWTPHIRIRVDRKNNSSQAIIRITRFWHSDNSYHSRTQQTTFMITIHWSNVIFNGNYNSVLNVFLGYVKLTSVIYSFSLEEITGINSQIYKKSSFIKWFHGRRQNNAIISPKIQGRIITDKTLSFDLHWISGIIKNSSSVLIKIYIIFDSLYYVISSCNSR